MKKTIYNFDNIINNNSDSNFLDNLIKNNILSKNPWLATPKKTANFNDIADFILDSIDILPKKKKITSIDITITKMKKIPTYSDNILGMVNFISSLKAKDTYDGLTADGTPFKIYDSFIQIGYDYIPFTSSPIFLDKIKPTTKKNLIEIYIDLTK